MIGVAQNLQGKQIGPSTSYFENSGRKKIGNSVFGVALIVLKFFTR